MFNPKSDFCSVVICLAQLGHLSWYFSVFSFCSDMRESSAADRARCIESEELVRLAERLGLVYVETSARDLQGLEICFHTAVCAWSCLLPHGCMCLVLFASTCLRTDCNKD